MSQEQPPAPPQQGLPPPSQPFPGSLTPGWNDPPSVSYNPQSSGTPGRTKLNKRVPFPLQQQSNKPTAIVQPQSSPTMMSTMASSTAGNIAVVHPLQHPSNQPAAAYTQPLTLPPVASGFSESHLPPARESNSPHVMQSHETVPTMFVPAVPRRTDSQPSTSVQHL